MTHAKRRRVARRGVYFCALAALGIALSGCGPHAGRSSAGTSAASWAQTASSLSQSTSAGASTTGSTTSGPTNSGAIAPASTASGSTASGSTAANSVKASSGSVTLNWVPPTENVDGTPLTNLAGYHIHYGAVSGQYTQTILISNPGIATYVVQDLAPGKYYFSVAAINSQGTESPLSSEVSTTVD